MPSWPRIAADVVLVLHVGYVAFVVVGLLLILVGAVLRWGWVRNFWFRSAHLLAIGIVVAEAWLQITCPLTTLENHFRRQAGMSSYRGDFIAIWVHDLLFWELPPWAFTLGYTLFGASVLLTFIACPPSRSGPKVATTERP